MLMTLLPLVGWAADLTVGLTTLSKTWGDADPVHPTTAQFTFNGTSAQKAALVDYLTFTRVDAGTDVGTYAYTWTLNPAYKDLAIFAGDDVFIGTPNGVLNITAKDISAAVFTVTLDAASYTYTGTAVEPTITSLKIGELDIASADYDVTFTNNTGFGTGNMTITGKNNLTGSQADVQAFTIVGGLSLEGKTATYAGEALTYTGLAKTPTNFTIEGLTYGTDFEVKAGSYTNNTNAGTASVTLKGIGNYAATSEITAEFGIAQAAATITPAAKSKNFGANEPTFTATVEGAQNGEVLVYEIKRKNFGDIEHEQPGTYTKALYVDFDPENAVNKNYTITTGEANFTIGKKAMNASGLSYQNIADQVYDATKAASANGITTTYTLKNRYAALEGPAQYYTLVEGTDFTVTYTNNTAVGVATVTFKGLGTRFNSGTTKDQTFNITAKPVAVTAKVEPATVGYGAEYTPGVTWGDGVTDADKSALGDINYTYKEKTSADPATATKPTAVGEYYVYAAFATANANYTPTINAGEFAITNGDLQAKVGVANVTYGVAPTFSIVPFEDGTSFPAGSAVTAGATYVVKNASNVTMTCDLNKLPVGIYTVTNTATATNYNVIVAAGTFEVSARALTDASIAVTALDAKPYVGAKVDNPSTTGKITFTYPGTTESYTLLENTDYTVSNEGFANINAGATAGSIKLIAKNGSNFTGDKTVNFEITKATLNIKANDATWEYGTAENPAKRYSATYTLLGQDADKDLTTAQDGFHGLLKVKRIVGETVGTYTNGLEVSFEKADGTPVTGDAIADNYTIVTATGKLTIDPSTITLVVNDKTGVYGDDVSTFASTLSLSTAEGDNTTLTDLQKQQWATFVNIAGVSYTLAAAEGGKYLVGEEYAISATGATSTNYDVVIRSGKYTVTQRPIVITATDQTISQGALLDQTAYTLSSALGYTDDVLGVTLSTTKTAVGGPYADAITVSATNANYEFSYVPGDLTITAATSITLSRAEGVEQLIKDYHNQTLDVKLDRNISRTEAWFAMVLPFEVSVAELSQKFGYAIVNVLDESNTDPSKVKFKINMQTIAANQPFLVKIASPITASVDFGSKTIVYKAEPKSQDAAGNTFYGIFKTTALKASDNLWIMVPAQNKFNKLDQNGTTLTPINAYLETAQNLDSFAPSIFVEEIDGTVTAINGVDAEVEQNAEGWYTINGVKLNAKPTQKGIYIYNGKKVAIQ